MRLNILQNFVEGSKNQVYGSVCIMCWLHNPLVERKFLTHLSCAILLWSDIEVTPKHQFDCFLENFSLVGCKLSPLKD